jgi:hypothetical protein
LNGSNGAWPHWGRVKSVPLDRRLWRTPVDTTTAWPPPKPSRLEAHWGLGNRSALVRAGALDAVVAAARAVDGALLRARRAGACGMASAYGAAAARELGREADEAYFLDQQGTRSLFLGDTKRAQEHLQRALELRDPLGDEPGAAATRHNLDVLHGGAGGWPTGGNGGGGGPPSLVVPCIWVIPASRSRIRGRSRSHS